MTDDADTSVGDKFLIEDVLGERLLIVFCGTALGNRSAVKKRILCSSIK
jgi:hypothetical protein